MENDQNIILLRLLWAGTTTLASLHLGKPTPQVFLIFRYLLLSVSVTSRKVLGAPSSGRFQRLYSPETPPGRGLGAFSETFRESSLCLTLS